MRSHVRLRALARARGQKTGEGSLREAQAGAASAVCKHRHRGLQGMQLILEAYVFRTSDLVGYAG